MKRTIYSILPLLIFVLLSMPITPNSSGQEHRLAYCEVDVGISITCLRATDRRCFLLHGFAENFANVAAAHSVTGRENLL